MRLSLLLCSLALCPSVASQARLGSVPYTGDMGTAFDFNGDGTGDFYVGGRVFSGADFAVLLDRSVALGGPIELSTVVSDWNGNGTPDLVVGQSHCALPQYGVFEGTTGASIVTGTFGFPDCLRMLINIGDVAGNAKQDIFLAGEGVFTNYQAVWEVHVGGNQASGRWKLDPMDNSDYRAACALGDVDQDGQGEYALLHQLGYFDTRLEIRQGALGNIVASLPVAFSVGAVSFIGDLDADGRNDVLYSTGGPAPHTRVLAGPDITKVLLDLPYFEHLAGPGDVDCDGTPDLLVGNSAQGGLVELRSGVDGSVLWSVTGSGGIPAAAGDINGDGAGDWLIREGSTTHLYLAATPQAPTTYCTGKVTSAGCTPSIDTSGTPTLSGPDDFLVLTRDSLTAKPGLFFFGTSGRIVAPFLDGVLCANPPLTRTNVSLSIGPSDCNAGYVFHFDQGFAQSEGLQAGDSVNGQFWMRDPAQVDGTGVALSNGIEWVWCP